MKSSNASLRSFVALAAFCAFGQAQAVDDRGAYVGVTLGAAAIKARGYELADGQSGVKAAASPGAFAGVHLATLPILQGWPVSVELGWQQIARHRIDYKAAGGTSTLTASGHSASLSAKLDIPLTANISLFGRLGVARNAARGSVPDGQARIPITGSRTALTDAFGAQYAFDSGWSLRGEIASFGKTSANSRGYGANLAVARRF